MKGFFIGLGLAFLIIGIIIFIVVLAVKKFYKNSH